MTQPYRLLLALGLAALLAGCANVVRIAPGEAIVGDRVRVPVDTAWNQFNAPMMAGKAAALWTQEGITIDQLHFYVGLKDGDELAAAQSDKQRALVFRASMQPHEVVALLESLYTRDGSTFTLDRLEAADVLGQRGWRARYTVVRKFDEVRLSGSAWGTVRNNELYAITFAAPAVAFYPRLAPKVEQVVAAARFK